MSSRGKKGSGSIGGGCVLWIFVLAAWGFCQLIFPKLPDYDKVMETGEVVPGEIVSVDTVENVTINGRHPRRVSFQYGDGKSGSMRLAMSETATAGSKIEVRVLGENAYPVGLRPFARPPWVKWALIAGGLFATFILVVGLFRLLLIGGVLFVAGRSLFKKDDSSKPPPYSPPPPPLQ